MTDATRAAVRTAVAVGERAYAAADARDRYADQVARIPAPHYGHHRAADRLTRQTAHIGLTFTAVDADDRYPGQYAAYVAADTLTETRIRVTPGNADTYAAPGYHVDITAADGTPLASRTASWLPAVAAAVIDMLADETAAPLPL